MNRPHRPQSRRMDSPSWIGTSRQVVEPHRQTGFAIVGLLSAGAGSAAGSHSSWLPHVGHGSTELAGIAVGDS